jgi:transposase
MRNVALDLGAKKICFCEVAGGQVVQRATVGNIASLEHLLGKAQPSAKVAIEACREAWYVHDLLVSWGNEVLLVDTTRVRKLGIGHHQRKNDKIDAEVLARAVESGGIPLAHVLSPARRDLREVIGVRRSLVEVRAQMVTTIRGIARQHGVHILTCATGCFAEKLKRMPLPDEFAALIAPLLALVEQADIGLAKAETQLLSLCQKEPVVRLLATAPGIGLVVAASVVSVLDEAGRFQSAHHVESYAGLVPSENSSGGKRRIGAISKAGNCYLRALLVQAAWTVMRAKNKDNPLYLWAKAVAERRGNRIAVVALARRLLGVLWAMWRDGTVYDAPHLAQQGTRGLRGAKQSLEQQQKALELAAKKSSLRKPLAKRKAPAKPQNTSAAHAA